MNLAVPLKETTSWMVFLGVIRSFPASLAPASLCINGSCKPFSQHPATGEQVRHVGFQHPLAGLGADVQITPKWPAKGRKKKWGMKEEMGMGPN